VPELSHPVIGGARGEQAVQDTGDRPVLDLVALQYVQAPLKEGVLLAGMMRGLLTLSLAAGCAWYLQAQKPVTITDGGRLTSHRTFAPTVGAALDRLGVKVRATDRVLPAPGTRLDANDKIEVLRPHNVVVVLNGQRNVHSVTGRTVSEVLKELSVVSRGALISPAPSARVGPGDEIVVAQTVATSVVHDGRSQDVQTNVLTAGGLLRQLGVVLGPHDRVEPSIVAYPSAGSTITVVRVSQAVETLHSKIPFSRTNVQTANLELGERKIKAQGLEGDKATSYKITYEDGRVKSRVLVGSEVVRLPVAQVTLVGTFKPVLKQASHSVTGKATWYTAPGMMAAHRTLPFGTLVRVTNLANGKTVTVTIRDRGPYGEGRIIDLSDTAFSQISPQSRGVLNVKVEW
jgi:resuscitation-promoting factor RpfB